MSEIKSQRKEPPATLPLEQYIRIKYSGNKAEFAREFGMQAQNVNHYIGKNYFVIDGVLWKKSKYQQDINNDNN